LPWPASRIPDSRSALFIGFFSTQGEPSDWDVYVDFDKFGAGTEKFSWMQALLRWADVGALISTFAQKGHPEAQRWERAIRLAQAVEDLVIQPKLRET
jgi:hypothetical protein